MQTLQNLFSPPLLKISPILLKFGMIALKTLLHKTVDQTFDIFLQSRDFGTGNSRNLSLCKFLNSSLNLPHQPPPHKRRDGPKILQGRVYETTRQKD